MLKTTPLSDGWTFAEAGWGEDGHAIGYSDTEWLDADVPGALHLDLLRHGIIADPHARMQEIGAQWADDRDWSYRCAFDWSPGEGLPRRVLRFAGLDTVATVLLNGETLGEANNMFLPYEFDVTDRLRDGANEIRVDFRSAKGVGEERRAAYFAEAAEADGAFPEEVSRFDARSFVRKMQCAYGWDWGPSLVSCGLWGPVSLLEFEARIADASSKNTYHDDGAITIETKVTLDGETDGCEVETALWPTDGGPFASEDEGTEWKDGKITLRRLRRWEPNGRFEETEPVRYQLSTTLHKDGRILDERVRTVGFSDNRLVREPDRWGESFEFTVNGERLWVRGANWIPDMSFPGAITRERLRERLVQAVDLGMNMLRVWGGGLYESDDFYELCDELGLLVWQDFPFACAYYPDTGEYVSQIREEAIHHIRRLRHHPCLALWCGNNENHQLWHDKWGGAENSPPRYYGEHLYGDLLPLLVAEHDPAHAYIPTSPVGPTDTQNDVGAGANPNLGNGGDAHYWDVWHGRGDWKHYADSDTRFSSEYGFASSCALATWAQCLAPEGSGLGDWSDASPAVRWHDKTRKGYETFQNYVRLHYALDGSLETWVYASQLNQRDAMRHGVEHFRREARCRGSLIWQLNDIWPTQSWALIDSAGRYKAAACELRRLYADRFLSLVRKGASIEVWAINDGRTSWPARLVVRAHRLSDGRILRETEADLDEAGDSRRRVLDFDLAGLNTAETMIVARTTVGENDAPSDFDGRTWRLLVEPKEARFPAPVPLVASNREEGTLSIRFDAPVVDLMLSVDGDMSVFEDNFVTVEAPGVRHFRARTPIARFEARSLAGAHAVRMTRSPLI